MMKKRKKLSGSVLIIIIIFGFIFSLSLTAVSGLIVMEHKLTMRKVANSQALQIAEAGLNYYRWRLAHDQEDLSDTANQPYYDAQGNLLGYYSVTIETAESITYGQRVTLCHKPGTPAERTAVVPESAKAAHLAHGDYLGECASTPASSNSNILALTVTGWTNDYPTIKRIIKVRYGQPSLAQYAFVTENNVWFGDTETIAGKVHANGGIRMDGSCDARMTSIKETYICGEEHGCSDEEKPGIWGTGTRAELWDFPITEGVDFNAITLDLDIIKTEAVDHGEYFEPSGSYGYLMTFINNGTFNVRKVTKLENAVWGYDGTGWVYESNDYKNSSNVGTYNIPTNGLIFVEDELWVEGEIDGRATVVAARLPDDEYEDASIMIKNNLTYTSKDGISVLGLIAQKDILVPLYSADTLEINAALLAQKGHVFRYYYDNSSYSPYAVRTNIALYGTIITNTVWTWSWVFVPGGPVVSGYQTTNTAYDPYLLYNPPPSFPSEDEYEFISWEEISL